MNVKLPSDYLSEKEKSDKHSNVTTYNFNRRVRWDEFKRWPVEIKLEFLHHYRDKFGVSLSMMGEYFEKNPLTIASYVNKYPGGALRRQVKCRMTEEDANTFRGWLKEHPIGADERQSVEAVKVEKRRPSVEQPYYADVLCSGEMSLRGRGSEIASTLFGIFRDQKITLYLRFEREEEDVLVEGDQKGGAGVEG